MMMVVMVVRSVASKANANSVAWTIVAAVWIVAAAAVVDVCVVAVMAVAVTMMMMMVLGHNRGHNNHET